MFNHRIRIDMSLTDEHILKTIKSLIAKNNGHITYEQLAEASGCHLVTVFRSTRRLQSAGRINLSGGKGRKAVTYEVVSE